MYNNFLLADSSLPAELILKLNFLGVKRDETSIFIVTINGGRSRPLRRKASLWEVFLCTTVEPSVKMGAVRAFL